MRWRWMLVGFCAGVVIGLAVPLGYAIGASGMIVLLVLTLISAQICDKTRRG